MAAGEAALTWTMTLRTRRPRRVIVVPGLSVLRFGDLVTSHRDDFDVGALRYERLPVLDWVLRRVKRLVG